MYVVMFQNTKLPKLLVGFILTVEAYVLCVRVCLCVALWGVSVCVGVGVWRLVWCLNASDERAWRVIIIPLTP